MHVQVNSDNHIQNDETLAERVEAALSKVKEKYDGRLTRIEVHLGDENSTKGGESDKRCLMEARLSGHKPVSISHFAATVEDSFTGAAAKLERRIDTVLGKEKAKQ